MEGIHRQTIWLLEEVIVRQLSDENRFQSVLFYCVNKQMFNKWMINKILNACTFDG